LKFVLFTFIQTVTVALVDEVLCSPIVHRGSGLCLHSAQVLNNRILYQQMYLYNLTDRCCQIK